MAEATEFESDQFMELLTDALRAGPGSPKWHEAVTQLRAAGPGASDEYRLLIEARERLESGREYRSVRAGPGFTRKVMAAVDEEAAGGNKRGVSSGTVVAVVSALVILAMIATVAVILLRSAPEQRTARDLAAQSFGTTAVSSEFAEDIPPEWTPFGVGPMVERMGQVLQAGEPEKSSRDFVGGGIVSTTPISPTETVELDVTVNVTKASDNAVVQLFVTETPSFDSAPEATTPQELVLYLQKNTLTVVTPDNRIVGEAKVETGKPVHLVLKLDGRFVVAEDGFGREIFAGEHGLSPDKPRWPGVRFLTRGRTTGDVSVQSVRIRKP